MSDSATKLTKKDIAHVAAKRYLADKAYQYILGKSQPVKLRQIVKGIEMENVTPRLMRSVMAESSKFDIIDRRWTTSVRVGDLRRPFERVLIEIVQSAGIPVALDVLALELSQVYNRTVDYYERGLPRILSNTEEFFKADNGNFGLASWLILTASDDEADVIFDSFLSDDQVSEYSEMCPAAKWTLDSIADTAVSVVKACKEPIPIKILALFAWRELGEDFDAVDFYSQVLSNERLLIMSDQKVYSADVVKDFNKALAEIAAELAALPMEAEEDESEGPIAVTDTDKEEIISIILDKGSASAAELLEAVLEVTSDESAYAGALDSLTEALNSDERIMWLGADRWGKVIVFPEEVQVVPESLVVPECPVYETPEGDVYDQMLEEEGFEGDLKHAIYNPLAEDTTDEDPARTIYQPNGDSQRCVLKYHHKTEGTFPMCQINPDFFGTSPEIIPVVLIDEGKRKNIFVNNTTRLMYGLKDFYKDINEVSGAVMHIEKTGNPGEFRFKYDGETDDQLGIDTGRIMELLDLKARFESQDMPLYDVITEILERQGKTFAQLVNEVNIVKRCSRLLVASILSSYHAFTTRGKSGIWQVDAKKASQGFNKTKKKYIKKD